MSVGLRLARGLWVAALAVAILPHGLEGQEERDLAAKARQASRAWESHNINALVGDATGIQVILPGAGPSLALGQAQTTATLVAFLRRADEVEVAVAGVRAVGGGRGYVELRRRFTVRGTQEIQVQRVLLGYRWEPGGWVLSEVRVIA